jgi:hypothetical protein
LEEIEVWRLKLDFGRFNWSNQRLNCENIKVWRLIKDLITNSQDQGPICKWHTISGVDIGQIRGQIEKN